MNSVIKRESKQVGAINIIFTSDSEILEINIKYLNHNYFTDVITFNYNESDIIIGDIFISIDRVKFNAKEYSNPFQNELNRVIIHGVLHLIGYNDIDLETKKTMIEKENIYLKLLLFIHH
jgi:probable rRNA maturation factor